MSDSERPRAKLAAQENRKRLANKSRQGADGGMIRISTGLTNLAIALLVLSANPRASATTLAQLTLPQLVRSADLIVRAKCISSESKWDNGAIWTFNRFRVSEVVKG